MFKATRRQGFPEQKTSPAAVESYAGEGTTKGLGFIIAQPTDKRKGHIS